MWSPRKSAPILEVDWGAIWTWYLRSQEPKTDVTISIRLQGTSSLRPVDSLSQGNISRPGPGSNSLNCGHLDKGPRARLQLLPASPLHIDIILGYPTFIVSNLKLCQGYSC